MLKSDNKIAKLVSWDFFASGVRETLLTYFGHASNFLD